MTRIVAGTLGGRRIAAPPGAGTRPTSDRVREALFSAVEAEVDLDGARFADLYAGSGAVGLEALSRGAAHVLLVESDARAARVIRENVAALRAGPAARLVTGKVATVLAAGPDGGPYDVVFADPPYAVPDAEITALLTTLVDGDWLAPDALVVVERSRADQGVRLGGRDHPGAQSPLRRDHPLVRSPIMRRAVCPGSFDPVTNGHLDIIGRASRLFDEVIVGVLINQSKSGLFTVEERIEMLREVTSSYGNVRVESFRGLLVDFCRAQQASVLIKGLRAVSDFDYELQMAQMNIGLAGVETLFMPTNPLYSFLSSSLVKDVAKWGGDISAHVPDLVREALQARLGPRP